MATNLTIRSWDACKWHGGWRTRCVRSPLPYGTPPHAIEDTTGWEPAGRDRAPREGYEYALAVTCETQGFAGQAAHQYWSRWRRPIEESEESGS